MVLPFRIAVAVVAAAVAVPAIAGARELAMARGIIAISEARPGLRAPACGELIVEARYALDNHLIGETQPTMDEAGACQYAVSVPAQTAVWLHVHPALVASVRSGDAKARLGDATAHTGTGHDLTRNSSVGLRFTTIASTTYFFTPGEQKTILLTY